MITLKKKSTHWKDIAAGWHQWQIELNGKKKTIHGTHADAVAYEKELESKQTTNA